jgi:hypothetical protein
VARTLAAPRCDDCRFYQGVPASNNVGLCRRFPPLRTWLWGATDGSAIGGSSLAFAVVHWPPVAPHDWCGEFKPQARAGKH